MESPRLLSTTSLQLLRSRLSSTSMRPFKSRISTTHMVSKMLMLLSSTSSKLSISLNQPSMCKGLKSLPSFRRPPRLTRPTSLRSQPSFREARSPIRQAYHRSQLTCQEALSIRLLSRSQRLLPSLRSHSTTSIWPFSRLRRSSSSNSSSCRLLDRPPLSSRDRASPLPSLQS